MPAHSLQPIAIFHCREKNRYDQPRQGVLNKGVTASVRFENSVHHRQALQGLEGFDRIWLIYGFHLNEGHNPMVAPPGLGGKKVGVFASRAPFRPNGLGLSCVRLENVDAESGILTVTEYDLLDQTPIYDVKPYLPYADSFPDAATGWVKNTGPGNDIVFLPQAELKLAWLREKYDADLQAFIRRELSHDATDSSRKRVAKTPDGYRLSYRTWRILFSLGENTSVRVHDLTSGYTTDELGSEDDVYGDKDLHRAFRAAFPAD